MGTKFWRRGPNLPPFSSLSTDLGHFILKLLNFDIYFLFYVQFLCLFSRLGEGGQTGHFMPLGDSAKCPPPWIRQWRGRTVSIRLQTHGEWAATGGQADCGGDCLARVAHSRPSRLPRQRHNRLPSTVHRPPTATAHRTPNTDRRPLSTVHRPPPPPTAVHRPPSTATAHRRPPSTGHHTLPTATGQSVLQRLAPSESGWPFCRSGEYVWQPREHQRWPSTLYTPYASTLTSDHGTFGERPLSSQSNQRTRAEFRLLG